MAITHTRANVEHSNVGRMQFPMWPYTHVMMEAASGDGLYSVVGGSNKVNVIPACGSEG